MCEPTSIMYGLAAVSAAYGVYTTKENARKQSKALAVQAAAQRKQTYDAYSEKANVRMQQARAERSRLQAASAESGLTGVSVSDILNDTDMKAGTDIANMQAGYSDGIDTANSEYQSSLNRIQQPDYLGAALQVGGSGLSYYNQMQTASGGNSATADSGLYGSSYDYLKFQR